VIGVAQSGLRVDACPVRLPGTSEVALSWHVVQSAVGRPIRRRTAKIAAEFPPVVFQLPCTGVSEATGRTRVAPRVETLLARLPAADGGPDLALTARVTPVASSRREESAAGGAGGSPPGAGNGDDADRLSLPDLLARARELPPPKGAVRYEIRVLRVDRPVPGPVHLDRAAAEETLAALSARTLRRFVLNAAAEAGLEARSADLLAGHRATKTVRVPGSDRSVGDPQIGTTEVGFAAAFARRDGQPGVDWRLSTIRSVRDEGEREVPETDTREGFLPLGGDASLSPISPLEGGGALALLVHRVP
jgi:hypothetical protein